MNRFKVPALLSAAAILFLTFACSGCRPENPLYSKYGTDFYYYEGLRLKKEGNKKDSLSLLKKASAKSSAFIRRLSLEQIADLSSKDEKLSAYKALYDFFPDDESIKLYCAQLYLENEFSKIVSLTQKIDLKNAEPHLTSLRIKSLLKTNPEKAKKELLTWSLYNPFSKAHSETVLESSQVFETPFIVKFRCDTYEKKYSLTAKQARTVLSSSSYITPQILSDAGKALLYGSTDNFSDAVFFENLAPSLNKECAFFAWFYAGRIFSKINAQSAIVNFQNAFESAQTPEHKDQALWYYLSETLKTGTTAALSALKKYGPKISDAEYYDDFFDSLCVKLFEEQNWSTFLETAKLIHPFASAETSAKFSYITARLIQENLIKTNTPQEICRECFNMALNGEADIYYRFLAGIKSSFSEKDFETLILSSGKKQQIQINSEAENLLYGYVDFKLPEFIYSAWKIYKDQISTECSLRLSEFLCECSEENPDFIPQSLRIASRAVNYNESNISTKLLTLAYPRYFSNDVKKCAEEFSLPEYYLYALIRSESFFDKNIYSTAGAVGLTQLMESTAEDISKKLKATDYDLLDASTNIRFGSYYLSEMIRRLDGSPITAFFSYNAGITRVRSWIKKSSFKNSNSDLFLESLPYSETRGYGRKLTGSSIMYALLYYKKNPSEVIEEIFK
ncbi:MAG: lytic transglycosylase domain-containing protein [Treponema sp.]|nr:lytic transglycosylase domain-containing protein [Treponema sp.]